MSEIRRRALEGIKVGDEFVVTRTFSLEETLSFGALTRDYNPVHYDERFARSKKFPGVICHGLLTGGMVCEVGGQIGWLASAMSFRFKQPVYPGDTITCRVTVTEVDSEGRAKATASLTNQRGEEVAAADLGGRLPTGESHRALSAMVSEGDVTNPLRKS